MTTLECKEIPRKTFSSFDPTAQTRRNGKLEQSAVPDLVPSADTTSIPRDGKQGNTKSKERNRKRSIKVEATRKIDSQRRNFTTYNGAPEKYNSCAIIKEELLDIKQGPQGKDRVRPFPEECHIATRGLSALHPYVVDENDTRRSTLLESCGMRESVTDAIVSTMFSQNTTDANSKNAFRRLKRDFPTWEAVESCDDLTLIENSIRVAGLAKTRAERVHAMLRKVKEERGSPCLNYIRFMSDSEVKSELSRFKGLGPKTISCVLLFALGRPEFPVDTHVLRITKMLKWVPISATRESAYEHLNSTIPDELKLDLHCLLVTHGKQCHRCAANGKPQFPPKGGIKLECPLLSISPMIPLCTKKVSKSSNVKKIKKEGTKKKVSKISNVKKIKKEGTKMRPLIAVKHCGKRYEKKLLITIKQEN